MFLVFSATFIEKLQAYVIKIYCKKYFKIIIYEQQITFNDALFLEPLSRNNYHFFSLHRLLLEKIITFQNEIIFSM